MATKIFCPKCDWVPGPQDRWMCTPGCFTVWNTFETHARCPGCSKQWRVTQCLVCHALSPHADWYHDEEESWSLESEGVEHDAGALIGT